MDDDYLSGNVSKNLDGIAVIGAELVSEQRHIENMLAHYVSQ
jgi:hypothetical protein